LTSAEAPAGFHLSKAAHLLTAAQERRDLEVQPATFGRLAGAEVEYESSCGFCPDDIDVRLIASRTPDGAHRAFQAIFARESGDRFRIVAGAESGGVNLSALGISVRDAIWSHKNIVIVLSGGYTDSTRPAGARTAIVDLRKLDIRL
jgi:hypothetical protein